MVATLCLNVDFDSHAAIMVNAEHISFYPFIIPTFEWPLCGKLGGLLKWPKVAELDAAVNFDSL